MTTRIGLGKASDDELSDVDLDHVAGGQGTEEAESEEDELEM